MHKRYILVIVLVSMIMAVAACMRSSPAPVVIATPQAAAINSPDGLWTSYTTQDGLAEKNVSDIAIAPNGDVWFATWGGVSCFDGKNWTTYTTEDGLAGNGIWAIEQRKTGGIVPHIPHRMDLQAIVSGHCL